MKLLNAAIVLILMFLSLTNALYFPQSIFDFFSSPPRLPQFAYDTHHCWLEENRSWLERLTDPERELCSLDGNLRPGRNDVPLDLFKYLEINNNRADINRAGWHNAATRAKEMLRCPAALQDVESFNIELWIHDGSYGTIWKAESSTPNPDLPRLLVQLLTSMPNLASLTWNTFGNGNDEFQTAFREANLILPSIKHLHPAEGSEYLVMSCPNLKNLQATSHKWSSSWEMNRDAVTRLIEFGSQAKNLSHFNLGGRWDIGYLNDTLRAMPNLTTLDIGGLNSRQESEYDWEQDDQNPEFDWPKGRYHDRGQGDLLRGYLDVLSMFPRLSSLSLPPVHELGMGHNGGSGCGNVYLGPEGRAYGLSVSERGARAMERAAQIVLSRLPHLDALKFGHQAANLTRQENGTVTATWPWTERMTEWLYEEWPEDTNIDHTKY